MEEVKFAYDSLLEGDGFEPSVPHKKQPFLAAPVRSRNSPSATKTGSFVPGTDGSNPSLSSRQSVSLRNSPPLVRKLPFSAGVRAGTDRIWVSSSVAPSNGTVTTSRSAPSRV